MSSTMSGNMLIRRLKISGMLSFGPQGIDLPMEPLNVLIGPNGSGKSNFIEALALLQAAPRDLSAPVRQMGGISEWLWKGDDAPGTAAIDVELAVPDVSLRHILEFTNNHERLEVVDERIEDDQHTYYRHNQGNPVIKDSKGRTLELRPDTVRYDESILSQRDNPDFYPELSRLRKQYHQIELYQNIEIGPASKLHRSPRADEPSTFLTERGENLAVILTQLHGDARREFTQALQQIYDGIVDFYITVNGGSASLFIEESGGRSIPASLLSDGTLRYMALAVILLNPTPPPLLIIENPELGLHPDIMWGIGRMLIKASERTQVVVTTHSHYLIDALEDHVSSIVVCEKRNGQTEMERLDPEYLQPRLDKHGLDYLWSTGELGGNRW